MNPFNINFDVKKNIINQNTYHSKYGNYKDLPLIKPIKNIFLPNYDPGLISKLCDVRVINKHAINILDTLLNKGVENLIKKNLPVVVQCVGSDFIGTNFETLDGIRDELFLLKTNFVGVLRQDNPYPIKDGECVYSGLVTTIRDDNANGLSYDKLFGYSMITCSPICKPEIINGKMNAEDFLKTMTTIETIFQTAILGKNKILLLPLFGLDDNDENPIDDIIQIYNYCILKYSHKFDNIIIYISEFVPHEVFELFDQSIVKPIEITKKIDQDYEHKKNHAKLINER